MDILVSSNFERLLWYIAYETASDDANAAGQQVKAWMDDLKLKGKMEVSQEQLKVAKRDFSAKRVSDSQTQETILRYFAPSSNAGRDSCLLDPHTAVGMQAANWLSSSGSTFNQVVLSTAHPAKFSEAVTGSLSSSGVAFDFEKDVLPVEMRGLLEKERRVGDVRVKDGQTSSSNNGEEERLHSLIRATAKVLDKHAAEEGVVSGQTGGKGTESI